MVTPVRRVRVNHVQFNPNRDPQPYRRVRGEPFVIDVLVAGRGEVSCRVRDAAGTVLATDAIEAPGLAKMAVTFTCAGTHVVTLEVEHGEASERHDLRLDVLEHAWVG